jgi:hypothetical protein
MAFPDRGWRVVGNVEKDDAALADLGHLGEVETRIDGFPCELIEHSIECEYRLVRSARLRETFLKQSDSHGMIEHRIIGSSGST